MKKLREKNTPVKVIKHLNEGEVAHNILEHKTVYTAIDAANTMKKKMADIVKTLLVKADSSYILVCLPADNNLDFSKLKKVIEGHLSKKIKVIHIPGEKAMHKLLNLKDETVSAFGTLHNLPVVIEKKLNKAKKAVFSSGKFNHSIEMAVSDFVKLENAILGTFGITKKIKISKINNFKPSNKGLRKIMKKKVTKKKVVKKAVKKAAPKKRVVKKAAPKKRVVKKAAPKKRVVKKAAPKKRVVKKTAKKAVKKVVKKAAPKKKVAKKAVKKTAKRK